MSRGQSHYLGVSYFVHPVPLLAVAVLVVNDHWLKVHYPSWVTGKLSDFAGLFFFPLFLCALVNLARNLFGGRFYWISARQLFVAIFATDIVFVAIKLSPCAAGIYVDLLQALGFAESKAVADPTDLMALISSVLVYYFARSFWREEERTLPPPSIEYL